MDDILTSNNYEPYFVPGIKNHIKNLGMEEKVKTFLGFKEESTVTKSVTEMLEGMSFEDKEKFKQETGQSWESLYKEHKDLEESLKNFTEKKKISESIKDHIKKEDPFKTKNK